jgi:formylglycine-generating enzyme required for sulfatase activity
MPIQNISYEAAVAYCEWLTEVYNQSTYKKKKFQKVVFRLPTESEWELAAKGGLNADYPWGDGFYKNSKGCYLSNTDVANETTCETCAKASNDGGFFTVPADSYFPNNFGLYNVTGNVAEMIATKNVAKGGSWNDSPANATTISKQNYTTPSPKIGVRIFMEVIEE